MLRWIAAHTLLFAVAANAQAPFPLQKLDDIGRLGLAFDYRDSADLGSAVASLEDDRIIRLSGRDDAGLEWTIRFDGAQRVQVFRGDLDANGRQDFLIASNSFGNGRCIDGGDILALLFDDRGRPQPWRVSSHGFASDPPFTLLDLDHDGRAELVATECEYLSEIDGQPVMAQRRWMTGVFEANDSLWSSLERASPEPYFQSVRAPFEDRDTVHWDPPRLEEPQGDPGVVRLVGLIGSQFGCVRSPGDDKYDSSRCRKQPLLRFSDGSIRGGNPVAVYDSATGLEANFAREHQSPALLLHDIDVRLTAPFERPSVVYADHPKPEQPPALQSKLNVIQVRTADIRALESFPPRQQMSVLGDMIGNTSETRRPWRFAFIREEADPPLQQSPQQVLQGSWLARDGSCIEVQSLRDLTQSDELQVATGQSCDALGPLAAVAARAPAFSYFGGSTDAKVVRPIQATLEFVSPADGAIRSEVLFERPANRPGDLVAVVGFADSRLAQWRQADRTWLSFHGLDGSSLGEPIDLDGEIDGYLLSASPFDGLIFLRWEDGAPIERLTMVASFEQLRR